MDTTPNNGNDELNDSLATAEQQEDSIVEGAIANETRQVYNSSSDCPICGDRLEENPITVLQCGHRFCTSCIDQWFSRRQTCPLCRAGPDSDRPYDDDEEGDRMTNFFMRLLYSLLTTNPEMPVRRIVIHFNLEPVAPAPPAPIPLPWHNSQPAWASGNVYAESIPLPWHDTQLEWATVHVDGDDEDMQLV